MPPKQKNFNKGLKDKCFELSVNSNDEVKDYYNKLIEKVCSLDNEVSKQQLIRNVPRFTSGFSKGSKGEKLAIENYRKKMDEYYAYVDKYVSN